MFLGCEMELASADPALLKATATRLKQAKDLGTKPAAAPHTGVADWELLPLAAVRRVESYGPEG